MYYKAVRVYPKYVSKAYKLVVVLAIIGAIIAVFVHILHGANFQVLNPKGQIGSEEKSLFIFTLLLSLFVVVPVFTMLVVIVVKYRATNTKAKYSPEWDGSRFFEGLWWGLPCAIIVVLAVVTWVSSHQLDPYRPIASSVKPVTVEVVALQWKWLFIYPSEGIATINHLEFPVNTPINFDLTADAPMNSFWIPSLGGQIYAMPGMTTQLHLIANSIGDYHGSSANISGTGFATMDFDAQATTNAQYNAWTKSLQNSTSMLTDSEYAKIAQPTSSVPVSSYKLDDAYLYGKIVMKYMMPSSDSSMSGMGMN